MVENKNIAWFHSLFSKFLENKGLKKTKQRSAIINFFLKKSGHIFVEDLFQEMRSSGYKVGLATIYRTLNLINESGLAIQGSLQCGKNFFEIVKPGDHHDHLFCLDCGKVFNFQNKLIEEQQVKVAKSLGFKINTHRLDLYVNCVKKDNCQI